MVTRTASAPGLASNCSAMCGDNSTAGQFGEQIDDGADHGRLELGPVGLVVDLGHLAVPGPGPGRRS